jgi:N utilization substance protein B
VFFFNFNVFFLLFLAESWKNNYLCTSEITKQEDKLLKASSEMINREIIRIKIVQLTYAYYQNGNKNIDSAEKELFFSLSKAYDLYNYLLALIVAITKEAGRRLEVAQTRAKREGTPEPSQKFVFNRFALQLGENKTLQEFLSTQKFAWEDSAVFLGQILETIESSEIYQNYMTSEEDSYDSDRELWRKLYKTIIMDNADLDAILEDQSLYWNDDKEIVDTFVLKTIKRFKEQNGAKEELLPEWDSEEEKDFARKLFRAAILNADQYQHYMSEASRNWDFSRLAYMDVILMQIAIAEMMTFPNVPVSVSINEYVDIAKLYSTRKSGGYINGMLDAIARNLIKTGRLMKHMDPKESKTTKDKKEKGFRAEPVTIDGQPKKMRHRIKKEDPIAEKEDKQ